MEKQFLKLGLIFTIIFFIFQSCSEVDKRPDIAKNELETKINNESKGTIKLLSFEKTDGKEMDLMGVKAYEMDFKAAIEIQQDCFKEGNFGKMFNSFITTVKDPTLPWSNHRTPKLTKGTRYDLTGKVTFEKKESGWKVNEFDMNQ